MPADDLPSPRHLYLVRHGDGELAHGHSEQSLTDEGRRDAVRMAAWAAAVDIKVDEIHHSGQRFAGETACIFSDFLQPHAKPAALARFGPEDPVRHVYNWLQKEGRTLMLVGDQPFLSRLASMLVFGDDSLQPLPSIWRLIRDVFTVDLTYRPAIEIEPAGLVALRFDDDCWTITCVMRPALLPALELGDRRTRP